MHDSIKFCQSAPFLFCLLKASVHIAKQLCQSAPFFNCLLKASVHDTKQFSQRAPFFNCLLLASVHDTKQFSQRAPFSHRLLKASVHITTQLNQKAPFSAFLQKASVPITTQLNQKAPILFKICFYHLPYHFEVQGTIVGFRCDDEIDARNNSISHVYCELRGRLLDVIVLVHKAEMLPNYDLVRDRMDYREVRVVWPAFDLEQALISKNNLSRHQLCGDKCI